MTDQAQTRRFQDTLTIAGSAVLAFGVWSLAKMGLFLTFVDKNVLSWLLGLDEASLTTTVYITLIAIAIVDMGVRAYVGMSARAEGRGVKKGPFYLVVAVIIAMANASSVAAIVLSASFALSLLSVIVSIVIEATAFAAPALVVYSSIRLRRMRKAAG